MKSKEVLKLLKISRPTLTKYVKIGKIRVINQTNGFYNYNEDDVFKILNKDFVRQSVIYARVSTQKQKNDLINQQETLKNYCNNNGIIVSDIYSDIGSGINFDRKDFNKLLNNVINFKINKIFITYKDRLSRISFKMFENLFKEFNCEIIVLNNLNDEKIIEKEIFTEIIDLIHCFSMKVYSNRRKEKLKNIKKELQLENDINI